MRPPTGGRLTHSEVLSRTNPDLRLAVIFSVILALAWNVGFAWANMRPRPLGDDSGPDLLLY